MSPVQVPHRSLSKGSSPCLLSYSLLEFLFRYRRCCPLCRNPSAAPQRRKELFRIVGHYCAFDFVKRKGSSSPNTGSTDTRTHMLYTIYIRLSRKNQQKKIHSQQKSIFVPAMPFSMTCPPVFDQPDKGIFSKFPVFRVLSSLFGGSKR